MSDVAGTLEIPVESNTKGFGERLKAAIEKETRNLAAKIEVEIDKAGLRDKLKAAVDEAAAGVTAKIAVEIDTDGLKAKMAAAAKAAGAEAKIKVVVDGLGEAVEKEKAKVEAQQKGRRGWLRLPLRADGEGFLRSIFAARVKGQAIADANPIKVKVKADEKQKSSDFKLPGWLKPEGNARSAFMPTVYLGIASVIQPAIAAIGGSLGGLVAMGSSLAPIFNLVGAAPALFMGWATAMGVTRIAFGHLFGPMKKVPEYLVPIRKEFEKLRPELDKLKKQVSGAFWKPLKDDIEPTGKVLMPILRKGLKGVATEMGETAKQTAAWLRTPLFKGQANTIFYSLRGLVDGFGSALLGAAKGAVNLATAAAPLVGKLGDVLRDFGKWAQGIGDTADEQARLAAGFETGYQKAAQLWDMTKNLGGALADMFRAGRATGDSLLRTLQEQIQAFHDWTSSVEGQQKIADWFESVEPVARAAGRVIVELAKALARLSSDGHTAALLDLIAAKLIPALEKGLRLLGESLGPQVITFVSNLVTILAELSAAGSPLASVLGVLNEWLTAVMALLEASPQLASNLGVLLGAFLMFRSLRFFTGIIPIVAKFFATVRAGGALSMGATLAMLASFSGILAGWPKPVQAATIALSAFLLLRPKLQAFTKTTGWGNLSTGIRMVGEAAVKSGGNIGKFRDQMSGFTGALGYGGGAGMGKGLKGALSGAKSAASGLMGLLGGPWGIALSAAAAGISVWMENEAKAKEIGDALTGTIDKQTGAFTGQSVATVKEALLGDLSAEDIKRVQELGFNFDDLAKAALNGGPDLENAKQKLDDIAGIDWLFVKDDADIMEGLGASMDRASQGAQRAKVLFDENGNAAAGATPKVNGYKAAADALATATDAARDAQVRLKATLLGISDAEVDADTAQATYNATLAEAKSHMGEYVKTVDKATGKLDLSSKAGRSNQGVLKGLRTDAIANWQAMLKNGEGVDATRAAMNKAKGEFVNVATKMLGSKAAAEAMAREYGYTTETVDGLSDAIGDVPKQKKVQITAETMAIRAAVALAKRLLDSVHDKTVSLTTIYRTVGHQGALVAHNERQLDRRGLDKKNGGIVDFFRNGGIREGLKAFARGTENHLAEIANAGDWRVWAEPETGGEAYIPLSPAKRARSMAILEEVADRFGAALMPQAAQVGASRVTSTASTPRASSATPAVASGPSIVFEPGSVLISNPAQETASTTITKVTRDIGQFGLFAGDDY